MAVVCCLLPTSAIMLSEKKKRTRKMWSKKWYLKRNISCDAHLLNELLETAVPWDDAIVVSAGKPRKLWDSLSELRSCVWKKTGKESSEACAIACQNCTVYSVSPSSMASHSKISQFNWDCIGRLTVYTFVTDFCCNLVTGLLQNVQQLAPNSINYCGWYKGRTRPSFLRNNWTRTPTRGF
jgi:hypothetical protein